jgi:hypothetical protein
VKILKLKGLNCKFILAIFKKIMNYKNGVKIWKGLTNKLEAIPYQMDKSMTNAQILKTP